MSDMADTSADPFAAAIAAHVAASLDDAAVAWSLGSFGAIAEFMRSPGETGAAPGRLSRVTARGAIRIALPERTRWTPFLTPSRDPARRRAGAAFCLPRADAAMARRRAVTEIGPDREALRPENREAILFDVGLAQWQVDAMVRTADPACLELLRAAEGQALFASPTLLGALTRMSPHRVFASRCGRIEVYGPIPPPDGLSPDGPHTHVLPKLLAHGRTHAANLPIPDGLVPCLMLHPIRPDPDHAAALEGDAR